MSKLGKKIETFVVDEKQWMTTNQWHDFEQFLHACMGFGAAWIFGRLLIWYREWVKQWPFGKTKLIDGEPYSPHDRILDTKRDLFWFDVGYTVGHVSQVAVILLVMLH